MVKNHEPILPVSSRAPEPKRGVYQFVQQPLHFQFAIDEPFPRQPCPLTASAIGPVSLEYFGRGVQAGRVMKLPFPIVPCILKRSVRVIEQSIGSNQQIYEPKHVEYRSSIVTYRKHSPASWCVQAPIQNEFFTTFCIANIIGSTDD